MEGLNVSDILNLAELLRPKNDDNESDSDENIQSSSMTPADIHPPKAASKEKKPKNVAREGDIWESDEVPVSDFAEAKFDPRIRPEYDIIYKQEVTPEDVYLQLGNKTASTASCEAMVITIQLPGHKSQDITLDVERQTVDVRTPSHRLALTLPHPVHKNKGKANWDHEKQALKLTLIMDREFDFINF